MYGTFDANASVTHILEGVTCGHCHIPPFRVSWDSLGKLVSPSIFYGQYLWRTRSLARWINAPSSGLELIRENIMRNHHVRRDTNSVIVILVC